MTAVVRCVKAARFLCRAAWRCPVCNTPWYARTTSRKARRAADEHDRTEHG